MFLFWCVLVLVLVLVLVFVPALVLVLAPFLLFLLSYLQQDHGAIRQQSIVAYDDDGGGFLANKLNNSMFTYYPALLSLPLLLSILLMLLSILLMLLLLVLMLVLLVLHVLLPFTE